MFDIVESAKAVVDSDLVLSKVVVVARFFKAFKDYEENFQDEDLWETFWENFYDFNKRSFRLTNTQRLWKFHRLVRKLNVWVKKNKKFNNFDIFIAKSLNNTLLENRSIS